MSVDFLDFESLYDTRHSGVVRSVSIHWNLPPNVRHSTRQTSGSCKGAHPRSGSAERAEPRLAGEPEVLAPAIGAGDGAPSEERQRRQDGTLQVSEASHPSRSHDLTEPICRRAAAPPSRPGRSNPDRASRRLGCDRAQSGTERAAHPARQPRGLARLAFAPAAIQRSSSVILPAAKSVISRRTGLGIARPLS